MTSKQKNTGKPKTVQLESNKVGDAALAEVALRPTVQAAVTIQRYQGKRFGQELELGALVKELVGLTEAVNRGNMKRAEAMLISQAHTLDALFSSLAIKAAANSDEGYLNACETSLRLALKAQSQCRTTLEALAEIKNPRPVAFVKQANIANNQQVNNGAGEPLPTSTRAEESESTQNKLLEADHGERLDIGTATTAGDADPQMETVATFNRGAHTGGYGYRFAQCL